MISQELIHKMAVAEYNVQCHLQKKAEDGLDQMLVTLASIYGLSNRARGYKDHIGHTGWQIRFKEMIRIVL